jgi:hypothetical protein|tara:strand:- start:617 stop:1093 length:477 start_codon:yes stop_codon:yes gene_type:complete
MPTYENYLSDASLVSDSESDNEEEESLYDERDEEYWRLEGLLETHRPPPPIEYIKNIGYVALFGCATDSIRTDIESVVPVGSALSWRAFWCAAPEPEGAEFSYDDWNMIGEYCMQLCECCTANPSMIQIRSCIIRILSHGKFVLQGAGRVSLTGARRH